MKLIKKLLFILIICGTGSFTNCSKNVNEEINCENSICLYELLTNQVFKLEEECGLSLYLFFPTQLPNKGVITEKYAFVKYTFQDDFCESECGNSTVYYENYSLYANDFEEVAIKCCQPFIIENSSYIPEIITISKNNNELTVTSSWENYGNYEGEIVGSSFSLKSSNYDQLIESLNGCQ
ncbi:MAG: hypothetical protein CMB82_09315 [Flammeovirgaceae bacterium]|nr:hypothetical protein [Flammeovirgaceae bacterium]